MPDYSTPPEDLTGEGLDLFNEIIAELDEDDLEPSAHEYHILLAAARSFQMAERIEKELADSDLLITGYRKQMRATPLLREVTQLRRAGAALLKQLFPPNRSAQAKNAATVRWSNR